jgi:hypothetical protein
MPPGSHIATERPVPRPEEGSCGNRVVGNAIEGTVTLSPEELTRRAAMPPFGIGPGFWLTQPDAAQVNGRAIYSTPASMQNTFSEEREAKPSP